MATRVNWGRNAGVAAVMALIMSGHAAQAVTSTWAGSVDSQDWNTVANWGGAIANGNDILFTSANAYSSATLTNTVASGTYGTITFDATAVAYTMTGNSFTLTGGIANNSSVLQTFSNTGGLTLNTAAATFTVSSAGGIAITNGLKNVYTGGDTTYTVNGAGGTLSLGSLALNNATANKTVSFAGSGNVNITGAVINGSGGVNNIRYAGTGKMTLSGNNTYTGATTVASGTVAAGSTSAFGVNSAVVMSGAGVLDTTGYNNTIGSLAGASTNKVTLGSASLTIGTDNTSTYYLGTFAGTTSSSLTKVGTGTLYIGKTSGNYANQSTGFLGATYIKGGILDIAMNASTTFGFGGTTQATASVIHLGDTTGSASATLKLDLNGNHFYNSISVDAGSTGTRTFEISSSGAWVDGSITLNSADLYLVNSGNTTSAFALGGITGTGNLYLSSQVNSSNATSFRNINIVGTFTNNAVTAVTCAASGTIAGTTNIVQNGSSKLTLSGSNIYTGTTVVNSGTLAAGIATQGNGSGAFGINSAVSVNNSSVLDLAGFSNKIGSLAGASSTAKVTLGTATLTTGGDNTSTSFAGVISGNGGFTKTGTGTQILTGASTYSGTTTVSAGALQIGDGTTGSIASGTVQVGSGASLIFKQANGSTYAGTIATDGTVRGSASGTNTLSGNITGSGAFVQDGAGTTILSGVNTYSGNTLVTSGELDINGSTGLSSAVSVSGGGVLSGSGVVNGSVGVNGGTVRGSGLAMGAATLQGSSNLAGNNTAASVSVSAGVTNVSGTTTTSSVSVANTATMSNSGIIGAVGATVNVANGGTLTNDGTVKGTVNISGLLNGKGTIEGALVIKDTGELAPGNSPGITTVTGALTVEGGAKVSMQFDGLAGAGVTGGYDQIVVGSEGSVTLDVGSILNLSFGTTLTAGSTITLIDNQSTGGISGTFTYVSIDNGTLLNVSSNSFTYDGIAYNLSYTGIANSSSLSGGNDLLLAAVPEPSTWAMMVGGIGLLIGCQRFRHRTI